MEKIEIQVKDKKKAKILLDLLKSLKFVDSVKTGATKDVEVVHPKTKKKFDFFSLAGLWAGRKISLESIRQKAWPRQYP